MYNGTPFHICKDVQFERMCSLRWRRQAGLRISPSAMLPVTSRRPPTLPTSTHPPCSSPSTSRTFRCAPPQQRHPTPPPPPSPPTPPLHSTCTHEAPPLSLRVALLRCHNKPRSPHAPVQTPCGTQPVLPSAHLERAHAPTGCMRAQPTCMQAALHLRGWSAVPVTTKERKGEATTWKNGSAHTHQHPCNQTNQES